MSFFFNRFFLVATSVRNKFQINFFFLSVHKNKKKSSINQFLFLAFLYFYYICFFFYFYTTQNSLCPAILSSFNILGNSLSRNCPIFCIFYSFIFIFLFILIRFPLRDFMRQISAVFDSKMESN